MTKDEFIQEEDQLRRIRVATIVMTLESIGNNALAAVNMGLTGFGKITVDTMAFQPMKDVGLINDDGFPVDLLDEVLSALSFEINRRVEAGTFV